MKNLYLIIFLSLFFVKIVALTFSDESSTILNDKNKNFLKSLNYLDKAIELANQMENKDISEATIKKIEFYAKDFSSSFLENKYENLSENGHMLFENLQEITAECPDNELKEKINICLKNVLIILDPYL